MYVFMMEVIYHIQLFGVWPQPQIWLILDVPLKMKRRINKASVVNGRKLKGSRIPVILYPYISAAGKTTCPTNTNKPTRLMFIILNLK